MPKRRASLLPLLPLALGLLLAPIAAAQTTVVEVGADGAPGQDGEAARAAGVEIGPGSEPVDLQVRARGGRGGSSTPAGDPAGNGGDAELGVVYGASDSGAVRVVGTADAGRGGNGLEGAAAGDGGEAHLRDAVDGDTAGPLSLTQEANGGWAGIGADGLAGAASSHLDRRKSAESLELRAEARAGIAEFNRVRELPVSSASGPGAPAVASARARNDAGPATSVVLASGGTAGVDTATRVARSGGEARAWASASTEGDGHAVRVGSPDPDPLPGPIQPIFAAAVGGPGGAFLQRTRGTLGGPGTGEPVEGFDGVNLPGGDGGDATSLSLGAARGRSLVEVYDAAVGGPAGGQLARFSTLGGRPAFAFYEDVGAGVGGDARSVAVALGGQGEPVRAFARAIGGGASNIREVIEPGPPPFDPGNIATTGEREIIREGEGGANEISDPIRFSVLGSFGESGGAAHARAQAVGAGPVEAEARADGGGGSIWLAGWGRTRHEGGPAHAAASGAGAGGSARARAGSNSTTTGVKVGAASEVVHAARAEARIAPDALDRPRRLSRRRRALESQDATAKAVVEPSLEATNALLAGAPEVEEALAESEAPNRPALGRFRARQTQWTWRERVTTTLTLELTSERSLFEDPIESYRVALLSPKLSRWGFEALRVTVEKEGEVLFEETFLDAGAARDFLDGQVLEIGTLGGVPEPFLSPNAAPSAGSTLSTGSGGGGQLSETPGQVLPIEISRRSEVAVLTLELVTRRPGAGLQVDFLVSTRPLASDLVAHASLVDGE